MSDDEQCSPTPTDVPLAPGLYVVATPIGNLEDLSFRALRILRSVDRIACEDTRQTAKLLHHYSVSRPLVSYHQHNERERTDELVAALGSGARIALVSDAGTPGISDPGGTLIASAIAAGIAVFPIPGASAALNALVASGLATERFTFHGFLPAREGQRRSELEALRLAFGQLGPGQTETHIFYEAPHRIVETLQDVASTFGQTQRLVLARELTKLHEEFLRGTTGEVLQLLETRASIRGELVLLLEGRAPEASNAASGSGLSTLIAEVAAAIASGTSEKEAVKQAARTRGLGKSEAYREWQRRRR